MLDGIGIETGEQNSAKEKYAGKLTAEALSPPCPIHAPPHPRDAVTFPSP